MHIRPNYFPLSSVPPHLYTSPLSQLPTVPKLHKRFIKKGRKNKKSVAMQQAISYKTWHPPIHTTTSSSTPSLPHPINVVAKGGGGGAVVDIGCFLSENALVVFGRRGCCMGYVVKRLLLGLGVNPAIYEVEGEEEEAGVVGELRRIDRGGGNVDFQLPVVFISGKLFGGLDRVMATHISGELVPILKEAGALWL